MKEWRPYLVCLTSGILVGVLLGWSIWRPDEPPVEFPAAEIRQGDDSIVLERGAGKARASGKHAIPNGGKVEREIVVRGASEAVGCPEVEIDLSLVRMPDRTLRVVASSANGRVVGGLDVPVSDQTINAFDRKKWAAGFMWNQLDNGVKQFGAFVDRDLGRVRVGVEAVGNSLIFRAGIRF